MGRPVGLVETGDEGGQEIYFTAIRFAGTCGRRDSISAFWAGINFPDVRRRKPGKRSINWAEGPQKPR